MFLTKRELHNPGLQELISDLYVYFGVNVGKDGPDISHADGFTERRALRTRSHPANHCTGEILDLIPLTRNAFFNHFESDQLLSGPRGLLLLQNSLCGKVLAKLRDPTQSRFERGGAVVDIVAIKTIAHFEAERVPGGEADRS